MAAKCHVICEHAWQLAGHDKLQQSIGFCGASALMAISTMQKGSEAEDGMTVIRSLL